MEKENQYVNYFYEKYQGRVAIGVGYGQNFSEIFPFVFINTAGDAIGIVALGVIPESEDIVYIYHLGAFISGCGHGSTILKELCHQADRFNICLSVSAISMPNGKDPSMGKEQLTQWYESFGFTGDSGLLRKPDIIDGDRN
jgi:hypothetical protein